MEEGEEEGIEKDIINSWGRRYQESISYSFNRVEKLYENVNKRVQKFRVCGHLSDRK